MNIKLIGLSTILGLSALVTTGAYAKNFTLHGQDSSVVTLDHQPQVIAAYDLSALDILNAIGVETKIVPKSTFAASLTPYNNDKYIKAGTLFEPDLAQLKQLKPDLIFVGGRSKGTLNDLTSIAPTVDFSPKTDDYIADLTKRSHSLAAAFGKQAIAEKKLQDINALQTRLKAKTKNKTAIMLFGTNTNFMMHAEADRFGFVYDLTGLKSVVPAAEATSDVRPAAGSPEALAAQKKSAERLQTAVSADPDYIIVLDRGAVNTNEYTTKESIKTHPILSQSQAVKDDKVIFVDANAWYLIGAGLDNTLFMLNEIDQAIQ